MPCYTNTHIRNRNIHSEGWYKNTVLLYSSHTPVDHPAPARDITVLNYCCQGNLPKNPDLIALHPQFNPSMASVPKAQAYFSISIFCNPYPYTLYFNYTFFFLISLGLLHTKFSLPGMSLPLTAADLYITVSLWEKYTLNAITNLQIHLQNVICLFYRSIYIWDILLVTLFGSFLKS